MDRRRAAHLLVVEREHGPVYYGKWRLDDGTQIKRRLGPAWLERSRSGAWTRRRGRPAAGFLTEKDAIVELDRVRREHRETIRRAHRADRTFGDVAEDWLRHGQLRRGLKRSTLRDYRQVFDAYLLPAFGSVPVNGLDAAAIERWHGGFPRSRTAEKVLMVLGAILGYALRRGWVSENAALAVEKHPVRYSGDYDLYSGEEIEVLIRDAASEQDAAIFATAAMAGLRQGELVALRWRDVDFAGHAIRVRGNYSHGDVVTPKSGKVRVVPMVPDVAQHLARIGQRERFTRDDDPVFVNDVGGHIDASALRRRYAAACRRSGLRPLPFHSLRHHFGSVAVNRASLVQVQAWMGHAHIQTTARYLHHRSQATDAALLAEAFANQRVGIRALEAAGDGS
ncbi:MAG: tyrosine-type recombinase/integrase [Solirubrobacterales bacterium]|nr:tyrosine-type recombinase/integrase [Solirubrobacterales bacterium]MBV9421434.1 tyrosine-type recombinase/integrase [Solirubrobacterales bacterium]MBV9796726.1 tyrosine-type recombinase/integrase [Solirubrobacterales bacterium]